MYDHLDTAFQKITGNMLQWFRKPCAPKHALTEIGLFNNILKSMPKLCNAYWFTLSYGLTLHRSSIHPHTVLRGQVMQYFLIKVLNYIGEAETVTPFSLLMRKNIKTEVQRGNIQIQFKNHFYRLANPVSRWHRHRKLCSRPWSAACWPMSPTVMIVEVHFWRPKSPQSREGLVGVQACSLGGKESLPKLLRDFQGSSYCPIHIRTLWNWNESPQL